MQDLICALHEPIDTPKFPLHPEIHAIAFIPKAQHRDLDPDQFAERYTKRVEQYQKRWNQEPNEHVPEFRDLERRIARRLRSAGLL